MSSCKRDQRRRKQKIEISKNHEKWFQCLAVFIFKWTLGNHNGSTKNGNIWKPEEKRNVDYIVVYSTTLRMENFRITLQYNCWAVVFKKCKNHKLQKSWKCHVSFEVRKVPISLSFWIFVFFCFWINSRTAIAGAIIGLSWFFTIQRIWIVLGRCFLRLEEEYWWSVFLSIIFWSLLKTGCKSQWRTWKINDESFSSCCVFLRESEKSRCEKNGMKTFLLGERNVLITCGFSEAVLYFLRKVLKHINK